MFVRQKKNKSGVTSVQIIDKSSGKYKVKKTIGSSANQEQINRLIKEAELYVRQQKSQLELNFILGDDDVYYNSVYDNIQQIQLLGPEIVLGKIFDEIGLIKSKMIISGI